MRNQKSELHETIVSNALEMFMTQGIKAVRMDDVAKKLRMSKRTLYEQFTDKEELLLECVKYGSEKQHEIYANYTAKAEGLMDILCFFIRQELEGFSRYNPNFFLDVLKYKPVREYIDQRHTASSTYREAFLHKGIEEGLIVDSINFPLLTKINKAAVEYLIANKIYEQYSLQEIFRTFTLVFLRGILTDKGQRELERYMRRGFYYRTEE